MKSFLQTIAAAVRDLVASGKAVHVTNETAAELDLLAGLFCEPVTYILEATGARETRLRELATGEFARDVPNMMERRSVSADDLALGWLLVSRVAPGQSATERMRAAECAELAALSMRLAFKDDGWDCVCNPHDGTREGARAVWRFIQGRMLVEAGSACERYRRELEAM